MQVICLIFIKKGRKQMADGRSEEKALSFKVMPNSRHKLGDLLLIYDERGLHSIRGYPNPP
ncbi:hypothetical protein [Fischerella thermalis]|uniref:hypothetical protein n=1 Tax=Fischerella thermalis TaxID=372787 RepID=UPI0011AFCDAD|nr:hypothetical protein [Fischerella thermalis]